MNPDFVELLEMLDYGRCFVSARGTLLFDDTGLEYLDMLAGFGVHNTDTTLRDSSRPCTARLMPPRRLC